MLDIKTLENWLNEAADELRNHVDASNYKDYLLPLIFLKRLSDVFDDEIEKLADEYGSKEIAKKLIEEDHSLVWFYLPENARWSNIMKQSMGLGEYLTKAVRDLARENPKLQGVVDIVDFNATASGKRIISDEGLRIIINILNKHKLGLNDVDPDILGRAYEHLIRKFAVGSGRNDGEFYTPGEVATLIAKIVDPNEGEEIYDPCLGSGGLLIKNYFHFREKYKGELKKVRPLKFYGQEKKHLTYAMAKMNVVIHNMEETNIALGDTMKNPFFKSDNGSLKKFDIVVANPMWNQKFDESVYENDPYNRFVFGYPPRSSADWGWIQHMYASLKDNGRMAVVIDTGAVSRGSGNQGSNKERNIRKQFVENDLIEAVILLPENLFYNTSAPGIIIVINKNKKEKEKILLINASEMYEKDGSKNYLPENVISEIAEIYKEFKEVEGISKVITKEEAVKNDYNLSPSRYVMQNGEDDTLPIEEAIVLLQEAEEERKEVDEKLDIILKQMGLM